jgi:hypothetical protein
VNLGVIKKKEVFFCRIMIRVKGIFDKAKVGLVKSTKHIFAQKGL